MTADSSNKFEISIQGDEETVNLWDAAMHVMVALRHQAARLQQANEGSESKDVAEQLAHLSSHLEEALLPDPIPPNPDRFMAWLQAQTRREDEIGALARFAQEARVSIIKDLHTEMSLERIGNRHCDESVEDMALVRPIWDALEEYHRETMRAIRRATPNQLHRVQLPDGAMIELKIGPDDFGAFQAELASRKYKGRNLPVRDAVGRIKAWVSAVGWKSPGAY